MKPTHGQTLRVVFTTSSWASCGSSSMEMWRWSTTSKRAKDTFNMNLVRTSPTQLLQILWGSLSNKEGKWTEQMRKSCVTQPAESERMIRCFSPFVFFPPRTGERCCLNFKPCGLFGKELHKVEGYILDKRYVCKKSQSNLIFLSWMLMGNSGCNYLIIQSQVCFQGFTFLTIPVQNRTFPRWLLFFIARSLVTIFSQFLIISSNTPPPEFTKPWMGRET